MLVQQPWTMRTIAQRAGEVLREEGVKALAFRVLGEIGYRRAVLFQLDLASHRWKRAALPENVRFEVLSEDKVQDLLGLVPHCDETEARRRIAEGHICVLGYVDGAPVYSGWFAVGPATAYTYEVYVCPSSRRMGPAKVAMDFRLRLLRKRGIQKCISIVVPENRAGLTHTLACGYQPIGRAYCLRLGGLKRCWLRLSSESTDLRLEP